MYIIIEDSSKDYCSFVCHKKLNDDLINDCLNIGNINIIDSVNLTFLVDSCEGNLVWQKISEK